MTRRLDWTGIVLHPYDRSLHSSISVAGRGGCSQHGVASCPDPAVVSFTDPARRRQSGCERFRTFALANGATLP